MADHSVLATLVIRNSTKENWKIRNPILRQGEYGLENDTFLIKIGDGVTDWLHLPYLNKLDASYFTKNEDGTITFSSSFMEIVHTMEALAGNAIESLTIINQPINDTDAANKKYVDDAIAAAGHLKREVVLELPDVLEADSNTLYMILAASQDHYEEYMIINGAWDMVGATGDGGNNNYELPIATTTRLGGVKASTADNQVNVTSTGFMTLNRVSTSKLYVPDDDIFVIFGGTA